MTFEPPTKSATKRRARPLVDLLRRADLDDAAMVEHGDAVGHRQRFALIVGDEDKGEAERALQALQLALHLLAQLEIERAERLVEQQDLRPQRPGRGRGRRAGAGRRKAAPGLRASMPGELDERERLARRGVAARLAPCRGSCRP